MLVLLLQVLCKAAKSDKAQLQSLEGELSQMGERAVRAEQERAELQGKLLQMQASQQHKCAVLVLTAGRMSTPG